MGEEDEVNWASRVPPRPLRRTTNPYPVRFVAVCGQCGWQAGYYDLDRVETTARVHIRLTGHEGVEVVCAEEVGR